MRGEQVAGEYLGRADVLVDGWFPTHDVGSLDDDGYLFLEGRLDDVIVRGGENISPGEIEDVLRRASRASPTSPSSVCPTPEWGEKVVAAVVAVEGERRCREAELQDVGRGAPALVEDPGARRVRATSCPTTTPASCCAASCASRLAEQYGA